MSEFERCCHNDSPACAAGLSPSPLCARCQGDLELGAWCRREYEARVSNYKRLADENARAALRQRAYAGARAQTIAEALHAPTWAEAQAILQAAPQSPDARTLRPS